MIERDKWVKESNWDSYPKGVRKVSSKKEFYEYREILDHYTTETVTKTKSISCGQERYVCGKINNGNGTFSDKYCNKTKYCDQSYDETVQKGVYRKEPVYKTKYYYKVQKWFEHREVKSSGKDNVIQPYWPKTKIGKGKYKKIREREGRKKEQYINDL